MTLLSSNRKKSTLSKHFQVLFQHQLRLTDFEESFEQFSNIQILKVAIISEANKDLQLFEQPF